MIDSDSDDGDELEDGLDSDEGGEADEEGEVREGGEVNPALSSIGPLSIDTHVQQPRPGLGRRDDRTRDKGGRRKKDHVDHELDAGLESAAKEIALIMGKVQYTPFALREPPIPLDTFLRMKNIAMLRRFFSYTPAEIGARLGIDLLDMAKLLQDVRYDEVCLAINEAVKRAGSHLTLDDVAQDASVSIGRELLLEGTRGKSTREKMKAIEALADRVAPKKSRAGGDSPSPLLMPPDMLAAMQLALELGERRAVDRAQAAARSVVVGAITGEAVVERDDTIDGEVLNVPRGKALPSGT